jgi:hypothetical protein
MKKTTKAVTHCGDMCVCSVSIIVTGSQSAGKMNSKKVKHFSSTPKVKKHYCDMACDFKNTFKSVFNTRIIINSKLKGEQFKRVTKCNKINPSRVHNKGLNNSSINNSNVNNVYLNELPIMWT